MRILVVDDEFVALTKMTTLLKPYGECDAATCARQAMEMFTKALGRVHPYDLVAIDIQMPDGNGLSLLRAMCEQESRNGGRRAKKIVVSGVASADNVARAAASRCDAFLVKPVKKEALVNKLIELKCIVAEPPVAAR